MFHLWWKISPWARKFFLISFRDENLKCLGVHYFAPSLSAWCGRYELNIVRSHESQDPSWSVHRRFSPFFLSNLFNSVGIPAFETFTHSLMSEFRLWSNTMNPYNNKTSRNWALLEKSPVVQLFKNFPAVYGTRSFIAVFTRAIH
jgi:hypothetical protein